MYVQTVSCLYAITFAICKYLQLHEAVTDYGYTFVLLSTVLPLPTLLSSTLYTLLYPSCSLLPVCAHFSCIVLHCIVRSNWIETIGSLDLASDQPAMGGSSVNTPHQRQRSTSEQFDVDYTPKAPPGEILGNLLPILCPLDIWGYGHAFPLVPQKRELWLHPDLENWT